ncbi:NADP-dependent oxidoreductase domain-containing protein [Trichoderma afarasin]
MVSPTATLLRRLGKDGPLIPAIGFGTMGMSIAYGPAASDAERLELLDRAWALGCTNWDTADVYGDSEDIIGKWFALHPERRKDIFLATKFGLSVGNDYSIGVDSSPNNCAKCFKRSLDRLNVDYIDLYYLHRPNPKVPIEKTIMAMQELVNQGKVKYLGLSEVSSSTVRRAYNVHPISVVQAEYSPWTLDIEESQGTNLLATCRELGISIFAYSPLGNGIMTGRYRSSADFGPGDARVGMKRFQGEIFQKNLELVDKLADVAKAKGFEPGQLVLAWLLAQGDDIFVIPGTKNIKYLEQNFAASGVGISEDEKRSIRDLVSAVGFSGGRDTTYGSYIDTLAL